MKLRTKTSAIALSVTAVLLAAMMAAGGRGFFDSFGRLERLEVLHESQRILAVLGRQGDGLERTARDYAEWDDTVEYASGRLPDYPAVNWTAESLANLNADLMLVFDAEGRAAGGVEVSGGASEPAPAAPQRFADFAGELARVRADPLGGTRTHGLKRLGASLWMIACVPVTLNPGVEPPAGTLLIGRRLDEAAMAEIDEILQNRVELHLDSGTGPACGAMAAIEESDVGIAVSGDRIVTHTPLRTREGEVVASAHMTFARPIHAQATRAAWLILAEIAGVAVVFGVLFNILLRRLVVSRLERLNQAVQAVAAEDGLQSRVPTGGDDEISWLGRAINTLLDAIARGRVERERAQREREALQEKLMQSQKMEAVGEFAGGIAHDFNNCLTAITGNVSLVQHAMTPGTDNHECLGMALASVQHAAAVVNQLLAYSRQTRPTMSPLSLRESIEGSLQLLRSGLPRGVSLEFVVNGQDETIMGDSTQLLQVVMNLTKNAADAMGGKGRITLSLGGVTLPNPDRPGSAELPAGRYVHLAVSDSGPGVSPELRERIFEPFFTTKGAGRGTGLGLAVVKSVVSRHTGAVGLSGQPGEGATFHIYLPVAMEAGTTPAEGAAAVSHECRVLLVDDDPAVRQIVERMIALDGCRVVTASDGEEAWETFTTADPAFDVVVTDLTMPRLGGMQLGERIFNSGRPTPVVIMTAYAATLDPEQLRRAGFAALIPKPIDMNRLKKAIAAARAAAPGG